MAIRAFAEGFRVALGVLGERPYAARIPRNAIAVLKTAAVPFVSEMSPT